MTNEDKIDWETLNDVITLDDDPGFFSDQVTKFITYTEDLNRKLGDAIAAQQTTDIIRIAHSLRGSALNFGAKKVNSLAVMLENDVQNLGKTRIEEVYKELQGELDFYYTLLKDELKKKLATGKK